MSIQLTVHLVISSSGHPVILRENDQMNGARANRRSLADS
jgi:hypothetical protein